MFTMPTAPKSIGGVLDDAFQLYRQSFWAVWPLSLLAIVLTFIIIGTASWRAFASLGTPEQVLAAFTSVGFWLGVVLSMAFAFWLYGAQLLRANAVAQGESLPFGSALGRGLAITPAMLLATIVYAVVLIVAIVLPAVASALVTGLWPRVIVALVLCVPFAFLYVTYYFYLAAIAVDDTGPLTGLGRSRELVRGNWWRVTAILTVGMIILMVVYFTAGFIAGLIATPIRDVLMNTIVSQILNGVLSSAIMPLFPVLSLAIYYDLKLRKFGGDLAQRVDSLT
jgi:hypothetical protein